MPKNETRFFFVTAIILVVLSVCFLFVGSYNMEFGEVLQALVARVSEPDANTPQVIAIWEIRLPRILAACLAGALLASAGAAYQGVLNNPLVDPYLLGVSAGAAFGAALSIVAGFDSTSFTAFMFALAASFLICILAWRNQRVSMLALILAGIIVNSFFISGLAFLKVVAEVGELREIVFWLMGGLYPADWVAVGKISAAFIILLVVLLAAAQKIDLMTLGGDIARTSGVNETALVAMVMVAVSLAVAVCVSQFGIIGWIGLGVPHFTRKIIGARHRRLILGSALGGAVLLLLCDTVARTISNWLDGIGELPVTVVTAFIGALFFLSVLRKQI